MNYTQELVNKFNDRSAHIAVLGLGYVGLPLAVVFAKEARHIPTLTERHALIDH